MIVNKFENQKFQIFYILMFFQNHILFILYFKFIINIFYYNNIE